MASLSSLISSSQYTKESTTIPLVAGMQLGSTYAGVTFSGGVAVTDPGGMFGWLIYSSRYLYSPAKVTTGDKYIVYTNPQDLVGDLNKLNSINKVLISDQNSGGTYGFFENYGIQNNVYRIAPQQNGWDMLYAIHYLAYGGRLVIAGNMDGFSQYQIDTNSYLDVVIASQGNTSMCQWLITQPNTVGIFPTIADSLGRTGGGYTMADFATLFGDASLVTGATVANRIFNVCGLKRITNADTSTLKANSRMTYTLTGVSDVGGFFTRSKNRNQLYLTVAGVSLSTILNGTVINAIDWQNSLKDALRTNRVNFFVNNTPKFLGGDLVGATANAIIEQEDRIGVSKLQAAIKNDLNKIGMKYLFEPNNATTRARVTTEMRTAMNKYSSFVFPANTQIICDSSNNTNDSSTLVMTIVFQPILSIDSFEVTVSVTQ